MSAGLPLPPTPLLGRATEVAEAVGRLRVPAVRLLTLTGPGGTGKTRLALQMASELLGDFPDGVYFVPLDALANPTLVLNAIAQALSVEERGARPLLEALSAWLRERQVLLVLDNFEHVLEAATQVAALLAVAPGLKVLATSREPLRLRAEHEFPVPPLAVPDRPGQTSAEQLAQFAAVQLFIQRALAVRPGFQVDKESAAAVAELCVLLDGLPLAIELAAARVRLFSPQALLARLKPTAASLPLLTGGARDLPARQQTLRAAIQWSYELLTPAEQALFRQLAVFAGSAGLEAIEAVVQPALLAQGGERLEVLDGLALLVEKSLLRADAHGAAELRYSLLHVIREFAREKLETAGETDAARRGHGGYYLALAQRAESELGGPDHAQWLDRLELEHDNNRAALSWAVTRREPAVGLQLVTATRLFWISGGRIAEGRTWLAALLALRDLAPARLVPSALIAASLMADDQGDKLAALQLAEEAETMARDLNEPKALATILGRLGKLYLLQGNLAQAASRLDESLHLSRRHGLWAALAYALDWRANVAIDQREYPQAEQWVEECLALTRELGDHWRLASALDTRGLLAYYQGDYAQAAQRIEEAVALCRDLRIRVGIRDFLIHLGFVCLARHNPAEAGPYFAEALRLHIEDQSQPDTAYVLEGLGMVAGERGLLAHAATLWGGAEALREAQQTRLAPADQAVFERALGAARAGLAEDKFAAAWNEGRRLATHGLDALLAYALAPEPAATGGPKAQLPAGLTAREAEILRLLAQGLSDAALASKLVISPRTVNSHLTSIYSKLGVSSRVAATRFAVDNGLA